MIKLTEKAADEVKRIIKETAGDQKYLRIAVKGSGCHGIGHSLALDDLYDEDKDVLVKCDDIEVIVDSRSALYIEGTVIDYHDSPLQRGFVVMNDKVKSKCNCGSSY